MSRDQDPGRAHDFSALLVTPLTERLGCRYAIIQTAMGWVADANLVNQVAYVRFASVYREFKDVSQFLEELKPILESRGGKAP